MPSNRILLVEDDADLSDLFSEALTSGGYLVDKFTNPLEAFSKFEENPTKYQLVISDVRMPGMSGFELVNKINEINSNVKVLLMTAVEIDSRLNSELKEVSIESFLRKPIHIHQLLSTVEKCIMANLTLPRN